MKKYMLTIAICVSTTLVFATPTEEVLQQFKNSFPAASEVSWADLSDGYLVVFRERDVLMRVYYNREAKVTKTIRYYQQDHLHPFIKSKIMEKYAGKSIFGITELVTEGVSEYHIILEDDKKWYHAKSDATGIMYLDRKYNKADTGK